MMKRLLMAAVLAVSPATVQSGPLDIFSDIYVFGDSLSDPGNLFNALIGAPVSPVPGLYPEGQITDGNAWATQIGADFASGRNFAFGSARAAQRNSPINFDVPDLSTLDPFDTISVPYDVPDFPAQIALYQATNPTLGANPLAAVWLGGNDLRDASIAASQIDAQAIVQNAITALVTGVGTLVTEGFSTVAVFGAPNLGLVPEILARGPEAVRTATATSKAFNRQLRGALAPLTAAADIKFVNIFELFNDITAPNAGIFAQTQQPCLPALLVGVVPDCSGYLFYDDIHPTEAAHALIAERFVETVAPVPLPAGGLLLVAGLGTFLVLRRKTPAA